MKVKKEREGEGKKTGRNGEGDLYSETGGQRLGSSDAAGGYSSAADVSIRLEKRAAVIK